LTAASYPPPDGVQAGDVTGHVGIVVELAGGARLAPAREPQSATRLLHAYDHPVNLVHDFYVVASSEAGGTAVGAPVLVHNADCPPYLVREFDRAGKRITPEMAKATGPQIRELADYLKLRPTNELSQGQRIYTDGKRFYAYDNTAHNGRFWKMGKTTAKLRTGKAKDRDGTYDTLLNRIAN
jgi:hypothetical protein